MKTFKHKTNGSTLTYKDGCMKIDNLVIEGTPNLDYWEEVVEKDYEILSFKNPSNSLEYFTNNNSIWHTKNSDTTTIGARTLEYCLKYYEIHSVKRFSDGEVFTLGDVCYPHDWRAIGRPLTQILLIFSGELRLCSINYKVSIDNLTKEEILLKTEDGFNIFEGEDYFYFWTDNKTARGQQPYKIYKVKAKKLEDNTSWAENARFFGKRENAEKALSYTTAEGDLIKEGQEFYVYDNVRFKCLEGVYGHFKNKKYDGRRFKTKEEVKQLILMSKPCLSLKELLSVWDETNTLNVYSNSPLFTKFKKLANEKL